MASADLLSSAGFGSTEEKPLLLLPLRPVRFRKLLVGRLKLLVIGTMSPFVERRPEVTLLMRLRLPVLNLEVTCEVRCMATIVDAFVKTRLVAVIRMMGSVRSLRSATAAAGFHRTRSPCRQRNRARSIAATMMRHPTHPKTAAPSALQPTPHSDDVVTISRTELRLRPVTKVAAKK